jgi:hypothetical protein
MSTRAATILLLAATQPAAAWEPVTLPAAVRPKLPAHHIARLATCSRTFDPPHPICIVIAALPNEGDGRSSRHAPPRPLLVYRLAGKAATLVARNDRIVLRRDEGGQCDPVEDGGAIAVKNRFFTLESGVACGQHWTDYITFRFDPRSRGFVWHNRIFESWQLNNDTGPNAEALVSDGRHVWRADPRRPVTLSAYVPR